ncbi:MAG: hypothetical protein EP330_19440 [Deltaproteobacteria bacterium]|nr:MAG: hypothetical protein EP330_19440 [Deltaproteobacteria bacterium]
MELPRRLGVALVALLAGCPTTELVADAGPDLDVYVNEGVSLFAGEQDEDVVATWHFEGGPPVEGLRGSFVPETVGRHTVILELRDDRGRVDTDAMVLRVGRRPNPVLPRVSGLIQRLDDESTLVAVPGLDQVVEMFGTARAAVPTCEAPTSIAAQGSRFVVACENDELWMHRGETVEVLDLPWGTRPGGLVWLGDELRLAARGPGELQVRDEGGALVEAHAAHAPGEVAVVRGFQTVVSATLGPVVSRVDPVGEASLSWSPGPDSDTDARGVPVGMRAMAVTVDAQEVVFGGHKANVERGEYRDGLPLTFETTSRSVLRALDPETMEERWRHSFDNRDRVTALAYSAHNDLLFVGHGAGIVDVLDAGNRQRLGGWTGFGAPIDALASLDGELWVLVGLDRRLYQVPLDSLTGTAANLPYVDLALGAPEPDSEAFRLGERVFHGSGDVRMSRDAYLSCASCHPEGGHDGLTWDFTSRGEGLRDTPILRGRLVGPVHWTGNFDELQDFEQDMRREQGGQGYLADADWLATEDALGDPKAGLSVELDALATYLESLPPLRSPHRQADGTLTADAVLGEQVFADAGCASCHSGPAYTDSSWVGADPLLHDVGTLGDGSGTRRGEALTGLDTPSLRGLWASAPYLHDGSAPTLRDVLTTRNPADEHGTTSTLTEEQLVQLEAFLRQIE